MDSVFKDDVEPGFSIGERGRLVNDGVIAERATGLSREKLNALRDAAVAAEDGAEVELPQGIFPKHCVAELFEFVRCHVGHKALTFTYTHEDGVVPIECPLCESEGASGGGLGECAVDGESLDGPEPHGSGDDAAVSPVAAPSGDEGAASDSRPIEGGAEDARNAG